MTLKACYRNLIEQSYSNMKIIQTLYFKREMHNKISKAEMIIVTPNLSFHQLFN